MSHASDLQIQTADFPATPMQERIWRLDQNHGERLSKNIAVQWELRGPFSDKSVAAAFQTVFDRHEILRTAFRDDTGTLRQQVSAHVPFHLGSIDLRGLPRADRDARIRDIAVEQAGKPFDLRQPGQLRATLVRLSADQAMLLIATHYGVFDGYSIKVLGREIGTLIAAAETGTDAALPELALQYGDYARWRDACAASGALDEAESYWRQRLAGLDYVALPPDRPRQTAQRDGATLVLPLPDSFAADLGRAAKGLGTSPFALGAAAMAAALSAATGRPDIGFTTCVAGRDEVELEDLIGVFVNPVVLRFDAAARSVGDLVSAARHVVAEALAHGDVPIDRLAEMQGQPLDPLRTPIVSPFFSLQPVFVEEQDYGPLRLISVPSHTPATSHDLAVQIIGRAAGWAMVIDYDAAIYDPATPGRFAELLKAALTAAIAAPETPVAALGAVASPTPKPANTPAPPNPQHRPISAAPATLGQVSRLWHAVLGAAPASPAADFFESGGQSLSALRLLTRIEAETGAAIAIPAFFEDPTPGGLACRIDAQCGTAPADSPPIWSTVPLRTGPDHAPLIVSLNQPFLWHGLAQAWPGDGTALNLHLAQPHPLETASSLLPLAEAAAAQILPQAAGRQVALVGHCVDGTLALLVAKALEARGRRPDLVAMVDAWHPGANARQTARRRRQARWRRWRHLIGQKARGQIGWITLLSGLSVTRNLLERLNIAAPPTEIARREAATNTRLVALSQSTPLPSYQGEVLLFATEGQAPDARPRRFGWSGLLPADTGLHDLPGRHEGAVAKDGAALLASILAARLARQSGAA